MVLYLKNVVRPSCDHRATCESSRARLPIKLEQNGEGGQNAAAGNKSGSGKPWLQQAGSRCAEARRPWGDITARGMVEVLGATLDAH